MFDSDDEDYDCPLCMEELDIADRNFRPCTCGYQYTSLSYRLDSRREYSDELVEFEPISADEITRIKREKKEKERQQKDMEAVNRRHLANMRVVQKNLIIRSNDYFGQFGKIAKVVINKRNVAVTSHVGGTASMQPSAAVYVTYHRKEDADRAIQTVDGHSIAGRILRASYGTTKYCTYYLRNMTCPNPSCLYLHEPGEEADTISKEELATGKHRMRDQISTDDGDDDDDDDDHHQHHHHRSSTISSTPSNTYLPSGSSYQSSSSSISSHHFPPVGSSATVSAPASASASSVRKQPTLESVATISYKGTPMRQHQSTSLSSPNLSDHTGDDDRSALPATASWAKLGSTNSGPSTPVALKSSLPDRSTLTPDNFGPPLAVAAAVSQKQQPQQQPQSPSAIKRKIEKKKRKELQKNKEGNSVTGSTSPSHLLAKSMSTTTSSSPSSSHPTTPTCTAKSSPLSSMKVLNDALVNFVLGDAMSQVGWLPTPDQDDTPLGVSALYQKEDHDDSRQPLTPSSLSVGNDRTQSPSLASSLINHTDSTKDNTINTLDFLLNAVPTPTYRGSFNPFTHQVLRTTGNLFESPIRKSSRFGFAQI
ncbi:hypothetical protein [Absidia glauca]|uniref:RRM domain-containing protein n=1 Tax=Absidia glauca TaxID=4829 RepID=A0A168RH73_ABSGL|nr:hypothetical protein [Absidia glauca]